jgi:hypothetical protein
MEAFDQRKSARTNHKRRSGNPEFEIEFTVESSGSSRESEEEAQGRRETSIPPLARESHRGEAKP